MVPNPLWPIRVRLCPRGLKGDLLHLLCLVAAVILAVGLVAGITPSRSTPPTPPALPDTASMLPRPIVAEIRGAQMFLRKIDADWHDPYMTKAVIAWFRQESGSVARAVGNNPLNVTPGPASALANGMTGRFLTFPTLVRGFSGAALTLTTLAPRYGYGTVLKAARRGDAIAFLGAVARSCWSASHYGVRTKEQARTITNHLIGVYRMLPMPERKGLRMVEESYWPLGPGGPGTVEAP